VDFASPIAAIVPGARGLILAVLAETTAELNVRTIARLAGTSLAQTSRILPELVHQGVVERRDVPPATLYRLVSGHLAAAALVDLSRASERALAEFRRLAGLIDPAPVSVIVYGSFARHQADADSDIDIVMVRDRSTDPEDEAWRDGVERWRDAVRRLTGNRVEVIEVDEVELAESIHDRRPFWTNVVAEGVVAFGRHLDDLVPHG
jgi:predicted nucleotidyltransferase